MYMSYKLFSFQVAMSSSEGSNVLDNLDPMELTSDDEYGPEVVIITSDSESDPEEDPSFDSDDDMDDFQPFALPDDMVDDVPLVDDVLALPPQLNDIVIIGHPEGEHLVEIIPFPAIPLVDVPFIIDLDDDDDGLHAFPIGDMDEDIEDGDDSDLVILEVASPVVSIIDVSSDSDPDLGDHSRDSVTSSALQAAGLEAYPAVSDDVPSALPVSPAPIPSPAPTHSLARTSYLPTDDPRYLPGPVGRSVFIRTIPHDPLRHRYTHPSGFSLPFDHEAGPSRQPSRPPPHVPAEHLSTRYSPPRVMPMSDPYHPSHYSGYTTDDLVLSLELQVQILCNRVYELEKHADTIPPPPPAYPPPATPPPPVSPPPPASPPLPPMHPDDYVARVLALEHQVGMLLRRVDELEEEVVHLRSLVVPTPPPSPPTPEIFLLQVLLDTGTRYPFLVKIMHRVLKTTGRLKTTYVKEDFVILYVLNF
ncbi:hypothetical protein Hdeb2414_s0012g00398901 [Helianthus debilis subsp. tardiflorus]